jgi:hypothetical protein
MSWTLYDYVDRRGRNDIAQWCRGLQKNDRIRLVKRMDLLAESGHELCPGLAGPVHNSSHLYKIKVNGSLAVRLLLCKGPLSMDDEYTFLLGAFERDDELPPGTLETAEERRTEILQDKNRRCLHERPTV